MERILSVSLYWKPANPSDTELGKNRIETGWLISSFGASAQTAGARAIITGNITFDIELGGDGFTHLSPASQSLVQGWTTPSYGSGALPTSGFIVAEIVAISEGTGI